MWPALVLVASLCAATPLAERIDPLITAHEGKVSVAIRHLSSGEALAREADRPMPTASLIKLPILVETYRQEAAGTIDLQEKITLREADKVPGSGLLTTHFSAGAELPLRDYVRLMIAHSDNTATNIVLSKLGISSTNETMETMKLPHTKIHSLVFKRETSILPERSKEFGLGSTTANEMVELLAQIYAKQVVTPQACDAMLSHLQVCEDKRIPKLLPRGTRVYHKTGSVNAVRTAAGIIETPGGAVALCVLTSENKDQRWTEANAAEVLTSQIALAAYEHFAAQKSEDAR